MNILKPHHDCYESPEPEIDFDKINDKIINYEFSKPNQQEVLTIFSMKPEKKEDSYETNEERLKRLKFEISDLKEEITFITEKEKLFKESFDDDDFKLLKDIQKFEEEMMEFIKSNGFNHILSNNIKNQADFDQKMLFLKEQEKSQILNKIFTKIDNFSNIMNESQNSDSNLVSENMKIELHIQQNNQKIVDLKKFKELESRLDALEKIVGVGQNLQTEGNIVNKINDLHNVANTLNPQKLEMNARKIQAINTELDQILKKNSELVYSDDDFKKIQELYEKFLKIQKIASELPEIVEKLECLKYMHENGGKTGLEINNLKENEAKIREKINENKITLGNVEKKFASNLKEVLGKFMTLETKLNDFMK